MRNSYQTGLLVLGADDASVYGRSAAAGSAAGAKAGIAPRAILIRVLNGPELAKKQGAVATFAQSLAPDTIDKTIYNTMRDKLLSGFKDQGVSADVTVVDGVNLQPVGVKAGAIARDVVIGLAVAGIVEGIIHGVHWYRGRNKK